MAESGRNYQDGINLIQDDKISPAIFICNKCERILTDSTSWVMLKQNLRAMITKGVTKNVIVQEGSITTDDHMASYYILECKCKNVIGRMYKSTPRSLDDIRDLYTLDVDAMDSYEVGKLDIGPADEIEGPTLPELQIQIRSVLVNVSDRIFKLEKKMYKLQQEILPEDSEDKNTESQTTADEVEVSDAESGITQISHNNSKIAQSFNNKSNDNVRKSWNKSTPSSKGSSRKQTDLQREKDAKSNIVTLSKRKDMSSNSEKSAKRKKTL